MVYIRPFLCLIDKTLNRKGIDTIQGSFRLIADWYLGGKLRRDK